MALLPRTAGSIGGAVLPTRGHSGGAVMVLPGFDVKAVGRPIEAHRVTCITGVPAVYQMPIDAGSFEEHDLSSLQVLLCVSAPVTTSLLAELVTACRASPCSKGEWTTASCWCAVRVSCSATTGPRRWLPACSGTGGCAPAVESGAMPMGTAPSSAAWTT